MEIKRSVKMLFVLVICFLTNNILGDEMKEIYGVVSGSAHLPCNITSPVAGDSAR